MLLSIWTANYDQKEKYHPSKMYLKHLILNLCCAKMNRNTLTQPKIGNFWQHGTFSDSNKEVLLQFLRGRAMKVTKNERKILRLERFKGVWRFTLPSTNGKEKSEVKKIKNSLTSMIKICSQLHLLELFSGIKSYDKNGLVRVSLAKGRFDHQPIYWNQLSNAGKFHEIS